MLIELAFIDDWQLSSATYEFFNYVVEKRPGGILSLDDSVLTLAIFPHFDEKTSHVGALTRPFYASPVLFCWCFFFVQDIAFLKENCPYRFYLNISFLSAPIVYGKFPFFGNWFSYDIGNIGMTARKGYISPSVWWRNDNQSVLFFLSPSRPFRFQYYIGVSSH